MLRVFAEAQHKAVPEVRKTSVNADREGETVVVEIRRAGTGYKEYADAVVKTIRAESRGFDRERQVVRSRRMEVAGMAEDRVERREEASRGNGAS